MANLRDTLTPKDWPDAGTPEFWERFGCEGSNEYRDCDAMSADYARLRRLERRMDALVREWRCNCGGPSPEGTHEMHCDLYYGDALREAMKEAKTDG